MFNIKHLRICTAMIVVLASVASADRIVTTDGSRLVGKIQEWSNEKVTIVTEIAGTLTIDTSKVTAIAVDEPISVQFASGDRLIGTVELAPDETTATMHTAFGDITVDAATIKMVWAKDKDSPEVIAIREEAARIEKAYRPNWTVKLEGGGVFTEGNTDTFAARGRLEFLRKTPDDSLLFYANAEYNEQNKIRTQSEYRVGSRYENDVNDEWSWYMRSMLENDEFENLQLRAIVAGGIARNWIKRDEKMFQTSLGGGFRHESYNDDTTFSDSMLDLGLAYRHDITPWVQFTHALTYSPALDDTADYRLFADTALVLPFKSDRWKLKLGVRNEYNSRPRPGIVRLDNTFYANVLVELK
jgi:putative salt-induced outer membrane protein YdiY